MSSESSWRALVRVRRIMSSISGDCRDGYNRKLDTWIGDKLSAFVVCRSRKRWTAFSSFLSLINARRCTICSAIGPDDRFKCEKAEKNTFGSFKSLLSSEHESSSTSIFPLSRVCVVFWMCSVFCVMWRDFNVSQKKAARCCVHFPLDWVPFHSLLN